MKQLFILLASAGLFACNVNDKKTSNSASHTDSAALTTIQWIDSTKQDLGAITEGQEVEISWRFKNTGAKPLVIESVQPGCGCTVAEKPSEPIAAGAEGIIKAKFDSKGRPGHADKHITVLANLKNHNNGSDTQLNFTADVNPKK